MKATLWTQRATKTRGPSLCIQCPYSAEFVTAIKQAIPGGARWFDAKRKLWVVELAYRADAEKAVRRFYDDVTVVEKATRKTESAEMMRLMKEVADLKKKLRETTAAKAQPMMFATSRGKGSPYDTLVSVLGKAELKKLYHLAVQCSHPDHGGNTRTAQEVNLAWEKICQERGI